MSATLFTTERLRIVPWDQVDDQSVFEMYSSIEVTRFLAIGPDTDIEASRLRRQRYIERTKGYPPGLGAWAAVSGDDNRLIGLAVLQPLAWVGPEVEVGWHLARPEWGHGYATEMGRGCLKYGFDTLQLDRIIAVIDPENFASQNVATRLGMRLVGKKRAYDLDLDLWELLRTEWSAQRD